MYRGYISRDQWGAAPPSSWAGPQAVDQGLILHWEGPRMWGDLWQFAHDSCYEKVRGIQRYHQTHGYSDIAYNFVICPHGFNFEGRGGGTANAASGDWDVNHHTFAICFLWGEGDEIIVAGGPGVNDSIDALNAVRNYSLAVGGLGTGVRPHREITSTSCPGNTLTFIAGTLNNAPPVPVDPPPVVPPPTEPVLYLGSDQWLAICSWQTFLHIPVNGIFDEFMRESVRGFQAFFGYKEEYPAGNPIIAQKSWDLKKYIEAQPPAPPPPAHNPLFTADEINKIMFIVGLEPLNGVSLDKIRKGLESLKA